MQIEFKTPHMGILQYLLQLCNQIKNQAKREHRWQQCWGVRRERCCRGSEGWQTHNWASFTAKKMWNNNLPPIENTPFPPNDAAPQIVVARGLAVKETGRRMAAQVTAMLRSQAGEVLQRKGGAKNTQLGMFHSKKMWNNNLSPIESTPPPNDAAPPDCWCMGNKVNN